MTASGDMRNGYGFSSPVCKPETKIIPLVKLPGKSQDFPASEAFYFRIDKAEGFLAVLKMLHIQVLLVAPLSVCHVPQRASQHPSGVAIQKAAHHAGTAVNLTIQSFNDVTGARVQCSLGKSQQVSLSQTSSFICVTASFNFMARSSAIIAFACSLDASLLSCARIVWSILATILTF